MVAQYVVTFLKGEMLHIYRQIRGLRAFRPVVFCQKRENPERFPFEPVHVVPKPRTHQLRRFWQKTILRRPIVIYRSEARRLAASLQECSARLLHVYFGHIGVHLLPLLEICPVPVIVSFHGADAQADRGNKAEVTATRRMFSLARLILARSEALADRLAKLGCPRSKLRVHRTGVPLEEIPFVVRAVPEDGAWRLLQASRLIAKKGLRTSLEAFAAFSRGYPKATFTVAGEGPMLGELQALAAKLGVADRVRFTGFLSQPELRALFAESHVFLHPSETTRAGDQEGIPNAMLEAMASGLPVAATMHGGIPEAVVNFESGVLVPERDAEALAAALEAIVSDPEGYAQLAQAASARVRTEFDSAVQARALEALYREALGEVVIPACSRSGQ